MSIDFRFYPITNGQYKVKKSFEHYVKSALDAGIRSLQIREKHLTPFELHNLCDAVRKFTENYKCKILVNDRCDIALDSGLAGVHLAEKSIPPASARKLMGRDKLIGVSVHSLEKALEAEKGGADFLVTGPLYASPFKHTGHAKMPKREFKSIAGTVKIPVFALGGVNLENAKDCLRLGAHGVAGITIWMQAVSPSKQLNRLKHILGSL